MQKFQYYFFIILGTFIMVSPYLFGILCCTFLVLRNYEVAALFAFLTITSEVTRNYIK